MDAFPLGGKIESNRSIDMKEFTITITSEPIAPNPFEDLRERAAGPIPAGVPEKKGNRVNGITITAHLVDVDYSEAQALLEQMKADAKKA